ncbi:Predicted transcriptional regulator YheO, contains PAS and DNA-binding HTH domains [Desulfofundulus australicus DSM 11792]|uniref:Predicted transcriptional regulator YheO, contains PAS and DNA-binding HTH domains n=1 Tax=Desulfofundulus australicus DSM 11792 TaxID=1121425 RepID=A0A1M4Y0K1_9FIRM|nr:PAS domain-containing protein [Desulfofundulus australicus]SHE99200.1 Predicted transcriptional regulator YheO, contains PAS and DNA-binding HTH domains [Desulfofundulus australicus DSM 11792]
MLDIPPELQVLIPIARGIVQTFGRYCEVAVHDLRNPEASLIYLAGNITRRQKGAPVTNIVLESIRKYGDSCPDLIGYKNVTKDGRILKSSTIFVRDSYGKIIGCLCINYDITDLLVHKGHIEELIAFDEKSQTDQGSEIFATDITEVLEAMIEQVINRIGIPPARMQKEDKVRVVRELDLKGVFLIKGAVEKIASVLGVSRYTIYNYLDEDRSNRSNNII